MKPWQIIIENIGNLLTVKAIISIIIVFVFVYKVVTDTAITVEFIAIMSVVITYWLSETKNKDKGDDTNEPKENNLH